MTGVRVLIIDDSLTIRAMLEHVISTDNGCDVVGVAADADTAMRMMSSNRPDVMTLDLMMPGIDGLQFLHDIDGVRHPPVVIVSSQGKTDICAAALKAGAVACFDKAGLLANVPLFLRKLKKAAQSGPIKGAARCPRMKAIAGQGNETQEA